MRPNLLLICLRECRHDALGYAGCAAARTPHLDAIAAQGWHSSAARASSVDLAENLRVLLEGEIAGLSIAELARHAGYDTMACGAVENRDLWRGFGRVEKCDLPPPLRATPLAAAAFGAMRAAAPESAHPVAQTGDHALHLLRTAVEPFFLAVFVPAPGIPLDPPSPWHSLVPPESLSLPPWFSLPARLEEEAHPFDFSQMTEQRFLRVLAHYHAMMAFIDHQVGRIVHTLASRAVGPTAMMITSAGGHYLGEEGRTAREAHPQQHEALMRVPALMAGFPCLSPRASHTSLTTAQMHLALRALLAGEALHLAIGTG